ncbi:snaclec subunit B-like [Mya arenaria]|uniref:snaclec subunit B-like n=1 Tax=Mya arenaria TaxID=6604 RepID=UPI0022E365BA|nr:snaclec subunit B-like [Mya arenaria]
MRIDGHEESRYGRARARQRKFVRTHTAADALVSFIDENLTYLPVGASISTTTRPLADGRMEKDRRTFKCAHECLRSTDYQAFDVIATPGTNGTCRLHDLAALELDARANQYIVQGSCGNTWYENDGSCYKLSSNAYNWTEAEAECVAFGGHLVSILSAQENAVVASIILAAGRQLELVWIGGKIKGGVPQLWRGGESWGFENFGVGEPNAADCCLAMYRFQWFDVSCELPYYFMCRKRA